MLLLYYTYLLGLILKGFQTTHATGTNEDASTKSPYRNLAPNNADFAFGLFKQLAASNPTQEVLISPISISMAFSMISLGLSGHLRVQLLNSLGFDLDEISETEIHQSFQKLFELLSQSDDSLKMNMGTTLFHNQSLNVMELAHIKQYYGLENLPLDFQDWTKTNSQINEFMKNKTQGKVTDFFLELESPTTLILINYISFLGTWEKAFDPENTRMENFYLDDMTVVKVPMMFQSNDFNYLYDSELGCMVVKMEYLGNAAAFFILPDDKKMDTVIEALSRDTIQRWDTSMMNSALDLYIPKFSMTVTYDLKDIMLALGIADLHKNHTEACNATSEVVHMSKVIHKANLQLAEDGKNTTFSKAFNMTVGRKAPPVRFNHPFIIMVFDHTSWSSLFLGKVMNPLEHITSEKP